MCVCVEDSKLTGYLLQSGEGEDVVVMNAKHLAQLLAQLCELLETLLDHLLSLRNALGHGGFVFPDAGGRLCLKELHLGGDTR